MACFRGGLSSLVESVHGQIEVEIESLLVDIKSIFIWCTASQISDFHRTSTEKTQYRIIMVHAKLVWSASSSLNSAPNCHR